MKQYNRNSRFFCLALILFLLLSACAGRPRPRAAEEIPELSPLLPQEEIFTAPESILERIKGNGKDIEKYFLLDDNGNIIIRADIKDLGKDYECTYDLEKAQPLDGSTYTVPFSVKEKKSELNHQDTLVWKPGPGMEGLLLSLDDDYMENWEQYFDLFDLYEARITFFIQGAYDPFLNGPFCIRARQRGHDVGYHSLNHVDLRKATQQTIINETIRSAEPFRQAGIPLVSFAYPFGFSETWIHQILSPSFRILRGYGVTYRLYNENEIRLGYISSRAIDNTVIREEQEFIRVINSMLRAVKFLNDGRVLPLTTHVISDTALWGISESRLEFLLKTVNSLKLKFYRYSDFAE